MSAQPSCIECWCQAAAEQPGVDELTPEAWVDPLYKPVRRHRARVWVPDLGSAQPLGTGRRHTPPCQLLRALAARRPAPEEVIAARIPPRVSPGRSSAVITNAGWTAGAWKARGRADLLAARISPG